MQGRTNLQELILRDGTVKNLVDNLYAVKDAFGIEAFAFFLDKNNDKHATGRLFYKVDRSGSNPGDGVKPDLIRMENTDIPLGTVAMQNIMGRLEMTANGEQAKVVIGEIAEMLNQDERFNQLIQDFEKTSPGKGEDLRNFALGQAAFRLVDKSNERQMQAAKGAYKELEDQVKQIKRDYQGKEPNKKQIAKIEALEEKEKPFEREMRKGDALLGMVRKDVVLKYAHDYNRDAAQAQGVRYSEKITAELKSKITADNTLGEWQEQAKEAKAEQAKKVKVEYAKKAQEGSPANTSNISEEWGSSKITKVAKSSASAPARIQIDTAENSPKLKNLRGLFKKESGVSPKEGAKRYSEAHTAATESPKSEPTKFVENPLSNTSSPTAGVMPDLPASPNTPIFKKK